MKSLHLHLYGPPSVGKSALAAVVFAELKIAGVNAELVQEYAKELVWAGLMTPERQKTVTQEQLRRESILCGKVEVIVTDSPPLLGVVYGHAYQRPFLRDYVSEVTKTWDCRNFLLERDLINGHFQSQGRQQSAKESMAKALEIRDLLADLGVDHKRVPMNGDPNQLRPLGAQIARLAVDELAARRLLSSISAPMEQRPAAAGLAQLRAV